MLPLIQPAPNGNDEKRKWVQTRSHRMSVTSGKHIHAVCPSIQFPDNMAALFCLCFDHLLDNSGVAMDRWC